MTVSVYADPSGNYATMSIGGSEKFRLNSDGTATLGGAPVDRFLTLGSKATTSGTSVEFSPADSTGIPSWAKKVTVIFDDVSTSGGDQVVVHMGTSSAYETTGYQGASGYINTVAGGAVAFAIGSGISIRLTSASSVRSGQITLHRSSGDSWVLSGQLSDPTGSLGYICGKKVVSSALTRIRITTINGTDTFDAGNVSVYVEG